MEQVIALPTVSFAITAFSKNIHLSSVNSMRKHSMFTMHRQIAAAFLLMLCSYGATSSPNS